MWYLVVLLFIRVALPSSLTNILIDQLLFASEPWRKSPVSLDNVFIEWEDVSKNGTKGFVNCTQGIGESLEDMDRLGTSNKFHLDGRSFINATLEIEDFNFTYNSCSFKIGNKEVISQPLSGHLGNNYVGITVLVEDMLSKCQGIVKNITLKSAEEIVDSPKELVNQLENAVPAVREKIKSRFAQGVEASLERTFKNLVGVDFYLPQNCGLI